MVMIVDAAALMQAVRLPDEVREGADLRRTLLKIDPSRVERWGGKGDPAGLVVEAVGVVGNGAIFYFVAVIVIGLFLIIPSFLHGTAWMNWVMVGSAFVSIPVFMFFPQQQKRLGVDAAGRADTGDGGHPGRTARANRRR